MDPNMFGGGGGGAPNNFAGMFGQGAGGSMDGSNPAMGNINPAMFGGLDLSALQNNPQAAAAFLQQQQQQQMLMQQQQQQASQQNNAQQARFTQGMFNPAMMGLDPNNPGAGFNLQALQRAAAAANNNNGNNSAAFNPQMMLQQQQQRQASAQQQMPQQQGQQSGQQARWQMQQQQQQSQPQQQQQMSPNPMMQLQNNGMFGNMNASGQPQQQHQQQQQQPGGAAAAFGMNPQAMALFQQNPMQAMQAFGQLNPAAFQQNNFGGQPQQQLNLSNFTPQQQQQLFQQAANGGMQGLMDPSALMGNNLQQSQQPQQQGMFPGGSSRPGASPVRSNSAASQQPNGIPSYLQSTNQGHASPVAPNQQQPGTPQQASNGAAAATPATGGKVKAPRKKAEKKTPASKNQPQTPVMANANTPGMQQSPSASSIAGIQGASLPTNNQAALAFERSRSQTRSPSVSIGGQGTPSQMHALPPGMQPPQQQQQPPGGMSLQQMQMQQMQQQHGQPGAPNMMPGHPGGPMMPNQQQPGMPPQPSPQQVVPPNWTPSLNPQQQQAVLSRALALAKAQEGTGITPVHTLMQMGYLFLKASSLPGGSHPAMMPNGGMVLTINEARGLGLIPQQGAQPGMPHTPQQPQQQTPSRQSSFSSMPVQPQQQQQQPMPGQGGPMGGMGQPMTPQQPNQMLPSGFNPMGTPQQHHQIAPQLGHPHGQRPMTPAGQHGSPSSSMHAPSPLGPSGSTSSPGMSHQPRPRQPSVAMSASGRPESRSGPMQPQLHPGQQQGLMAPPPAPGHMPPQGMPGPGMPGMVPPGSMPPGLPSSVPGAAPGFGVPPPGPQMQDPAAAAAAAAMAGAVPPNLKQQGRRPSAIHDPALTSTPDNRRSSILDARTGPPQPPTAATDPLMLAAANAATAQPSAQTQLIGSFAPAASASVRPGQAGPEAPAAGQPTTLAGLAPAAFAESVPSNLANMPMLLGGPAPKESAAGTPITRFNTRVTKLTDDMRPEKPVKAEGADKDKSKDDTSASAAIEEEAEAEEDEIWTPLTKEQEEELLQIMKRDLEYEQLYRKQQFSMEKSLKDRIDAVRPPRRKASDGTITRPKQLSWWERPEEEDTSGLSREMYRPFQLLFPAQKRMEMEQGQRGPRPVVPLKRAQMESVSVQGEDLVPIRLEIDHEHWKLRDTFTWNALDTHINVEAFAQSICEDIGLPAHVFIPQIREQITSQISDHLTTNALKAKPSFFEDTLAKGDDGKDGKGSLEGKDLLWWSKWRNKVDTLPESLIAARKAKRAKLAAQTSDIAADLSKEAASLHDGDHQQGAVNGNGQEAMEVDDSEEEDKPSESAETIDTTPAEELRLTIKLDITVGSMNLVDQFEWDANESDPNAAEKFAEAFAAELGLAGEFRTAIAHSIREQVSVHLKSLAMTGHLFDGRPIADEELRTAFLGPISKNNAFRGDHDKYNFTPRLLQLTESEIERLDREREREARRKRRQTRGRRGINLPDREPQKTQRTPAVYGIQTAQSDQTSLDKASAINDRYGGMSTRRAAAAAANASIAPSHSNDFGTPTPGPDAGLPDRKRSKVNHHAVHFTHPGGLGRKSDPGGPKFAPDYLEEEAKKRARSPDNQATGPQNVERPGPKPVSLSYAQRNNVRPEDLERQHPNFHDGMWHCSNCGIPGTLAPGRRKGPLGDKSLCGPCGKYYHRHRKVLIVEYTRDPVFHMKQQQALNRKMGISNPVIDTALLNALGAEQAGDSTEPTSAADTPKGEDGNGAGEDGVVKKEGGRRSIKLRGSGKASLAVGSDDEEDLPFEMVGSPDDSDSSSRSSSPEPAPTSRSRKHNTEDSSHDSAMSHSHPRRAAGEAARERMSASLAPADPNAEEGEIEQTEVKEEPASNQPSALATSVGAAGSPSSTAAVAAPTTPGMSNASPRLAQSVPGAVPPEWLKASGAALKARYPNDRFEIQQRPRPAGVPPPPQAEWRVRCLDCPGKLYTPGPGESLNNFEIHLRNRIHRANVNKRVYGNTAPPGASGSPGGTPGSTHKSPSVSHAAPP